MGKHTSAPFEKPTVSLSDCLTGLSGTARLRAMLKIYGRAAFRANLTHRWLQLLNSHDLFNNLVRIRPRFIHKPYRPYISNLLSHTTRFRVIQQHYAFILEQGLDLMIEKASREPVDLVRFTGKTGNAYGIHMRAIDPMEREGELVLQLSRNQVLLYSCAFTFFQENGRLHIYIGCIQGARAKNAVPLIRSTTRDMYGMRPKNLLIRLVEQLGIQFNCETLRMVANAHRTVRRSIQQGKVFSDYDSLWSELGATKRKDGDYELNCKKIVPPVMTLVPSKKRSEVKKRYDQLASIVSNIKQNFLDFPKTIPASLSPPCDGSAPSALLRIAKTTLHS